MSLSNRGSRGVGSFSGIGGRLSNPASPFSWYLKTRWAAKVLAVWE